jgi:pimeloyl-ACP methyl ester carboxylesterase
MPSPRPSSVRSGDLTLSVRTHSPAGPGRPTVVLVHGYPDRQDTWDTLVGHLPLDRWHVVTYDVRGAGGSDVPRRREDYRTERLVDDLVAVLDAVLATGEAVHLVGHDWGSVQLWDAVAAESTDPRLTGRIASYTSMSGPSLDHAGLVSQHRAGRRVALARQLARSWYVDAFHVPVLPELLWRTAHGPIGAVVAARQGLPRDHWGPGLGEDAAHGLELYRANVLRRMRRPVPFRTDVPVLVIHPERDPFVTEVLLEDLQDRCTDLRIERLDAGHWLIVTAADRVAALLVPHVDAHA